MDLLGSIIHGVEASAVGTLAMDAVLYRRYRNGSGRAAFAAWESSEGVESWEGAPAPALVAKQLLERVIGREVPPRYARLLNNVTHWGLGLTAGVGYGLIVGSRKSKLRYGLPFGAAVWAGGYVVLPRLGVYQEIWSYDLETLEKDLSAHLVFGTATAAAFSLLSRTSTRGDSGTAGGVRGLRQRRRRPRARRGATGHAHRAPDAPAASAARLPRGGAPADRTRASDP